MLCICLVSSYKEIVFETGCESTIWKACDRLMHNGQLSDPLNEWTKAKKKITDKKKKTDADHEEVSRLEWMGGLYLFNGAPCIPREAIKATLLRAGDP